VGWGGVGGTARACLPHTPTFSTLFPFSEGEKGNNYRIIANDLSKIARCCLLDFFSKYPTLTTGPFYSPRGVICTAIVGGENESPFSRVK
jgi:hypothetical protein